MPGLGGVVPGRAYRRYRAAVRAARSRRAPRWVSSWLSGSPLRCAPTTATLTLSLPGAIGAGGGSWSSIAPSRSPVRWWKRCARSASMRSLPAGPISVMPTGSPSGRIEAGTAIGGEVEQVDEVGVVPEAPVGLERIGQHFHRWCTRSARWAPPAHRWSPTRARPPSSARASASWPGTDRWRSSLAAPPMISRTTGWIWSACVSKKGLMAAMRSATQGPS